MISGTTGESPTTTDAEKAELLRGGARGRRRPGRRARRGRHVQHRAHARAGPRRPPDVGAARAAGGHALLLQAAAGRAAGSTSARSPTPPTCRSCSTTSRAAPAWRSPPRPCSGWPSIRGSSRSRTPRATWPPRRRVLAGTDLAYYSGDDALTLPLLSIGGVGRGRHVDPLQRARHQGADRGVRRPATSATALARHRQLLPIFTGIFATQGCILVKAGSGAAGPRRRRPALAAGRRHRRPRSRGARGQPAAAGLPTAEPSSAAAAGNARWHRAHVAPV